MESAHQDDEISVSYLGLAAAMHSITAPAIRSAIQALELDAGSRGVDVGCGVGTHTRWLAEAVVPNGQVTGLDLSTECLARARKAAAKSELAARVSFRHGDMSDLPFSDDSFDWAWSADTLWIGLPGQELPARDPLSILRELSRVVRPGGTAAASGVPAAGGSAECHLCGELSIHRRCTARAAHLARPGLAAGGGPRGSDGTHVRG
jgi:ubiquinone/menaquinone biosynthesis C-methylase UbiE